MHSGRTTPQIINSDYAPFYYSVHSTFRLPAFSSDAAAMISLLRRPARFLPFLRRERNNNRLWCSKTDDGDTGKQKRRATIEFVNPPNENEPDEKLFREEYHSEDGTLFYGTDVDKKMEKGDWQEFEKTFGLDKLHNIKNFEDWNFKSVGSKEDVIDLKDDSTSMYEKAQVLADQFVNSGTQMNREEERQHELEEERNWKQFEEFVETSLANPSTTVPVDSYGSIFEQDGEEEVETVSEKRSPKRQAPDDGSTHKLDRSRPKSFKHRQSISSSRSLPSPPSPHSSSSPLSTVKSPEELLTMPVNTRRPGYERRLRSLEAEMERITSEILGETDSEFDDFGAIMQHAMLSSDGFTFRVFFQLADTRKQNDKKKFRIWKKRICNQVRAALAAQLHAKRVPKVELVHAQPDTENSNVYGTSQFTSEGRAELDRLFEQIATERKRAKTDNTSDMSEDDFIDPDVQSEFIKK